MVTDYLAIYAAFLSTVVFVWNLRRARPRVALKLVPGVHDDGGLGIFISVQNTSAHTIHLSALSVVYPYANRTPRQRLWHVLRYRRWPVIAGWVHISLQTYEVDDGFPLSLGGWQKHDVFIPQASLESMLREAIRPEVRASVQDALWRDTYSRILTIN